MTGFQGVNLVAPTTGNYAGILFMQDRNLSFGSGDSRYNNNMGTGLTIGTYQGTLYFPTTGLTWNGVTAAAYTLIVAQQLSFNFGIPSSPSEIILPHCRMDRRSKPSEPSNSQGANRTCSPSV